MEAANLGIMHALSEQWDDFPKGARPKSYGIRVESFEEEGNAHLHVDKSYEFFTTRLQSFISLIQGAYIGGGGVGSLLELSFLWQLKQVNHLLIDFPLIASLAWKPVIDSFEEMAIYGRDGLAPLMDDNDKDLLYFSDNVEEIVEIFHQAKSKWDRRRKLDVF